MINYFFDVQLWERTFVDYVLLAADALPSLPLLVFR